MNIEINKMRTEVVNEFAEAGRAALEFDTLSAGVIGAIPNTDPQQYVVAGTLQIIGKLLPAVEQRAQAELTENEILDALVHIRPEDYGLPPFATGYLEYDLACGRAIEQVMRDRVRSAAREQARNEAQWISVDEREPEEGQHCIVLFWPYNNHENEQIEGIADYIDGTFMNHEGDELHPPSHWMPFPNVARPAVIKAEAPAASKEGGDRG